MNTNQLPSHDWSDNPTNCCPRFHPEGWEGTELHFEDKPFVKASNWGIFHIPLNLGSVFERTFKAIDDNDASDKEHYFILSYDPSPWRGEHLFSVTKDVPGQEMVKLNGDFLNKVFEGPYRDVPKWETAMQDWVSSQGKTAEKVYFFYTTCPKCAKYYGKNYVVAVAKVV